LSVFVHLRAELGGYVGLAAAGGERLADVLLALAEAVHVGRVEEVDAVVERGVHDGCRACRVQASPEVVAADPDNRDVERSDLPCLHDVSPPPWTVGSVYGPG